MVDGIDYCFGICRSVRRDCHAVDCHRVGPSQAGQGGADQAGIGTGYGDARSIATSIVNLRKDEQISSIPWLNKKLLQFELTPYLRKVLDQANLSWSAGRLLMMSGGLLCGACLTLSICVFGMVCRLWVSGLLRGLARTALCCSSATSASASLKRDCRRRWI